MHAAKFPLTELIHSRGKQAKPLCKKIDVTYQFVLDCCTGKSAMPISLKRRLARALGVSVATIIRRLPKTGKEKRTVLNCGNCPRIAALERELAELRGRLGQAASVLNKEAA